MARIRSVSPTLRSSETCAAWSREVRYAWVLLWGYLDDYGRGVDNARVIAADCFPFDDDVTADLMGDWLITYEAAGSICRYEVEQKRYLHALNWSDHQKPQHPSKVRIPPCPTHEPGAHLRWSKDRESERAKVSGGPHEGLVTASPTSRGGGEVSTEVSDEMRGGRSSGAKGAPPLFPDHCPRHANNPTPGPCGDCADTRKARAAMPRLALVGPHNPATVPHCGQCDETRHLETPVGVIRCPECHPRAEEAS